MELTNKQEQGLKIAIQRYRDGEKYTVISGYAGTGKSTLVKFIISALDIDEDDVCYAAFTGKAAQVLLKKGNPNVRTLHKLLYKHIPKRDGGFIKVPYPSIDFKIVIVDEVSMAPASLMSLLFSHNVHVICLGDPFQLPPIDKTEDNHLLEHPHIFLDEIMRQEAESEIIRLSMAIRNFELFPNQIGKEVQVLRRGELNTGMLTWADQILVGTNKTRIDMNNQMRQLMGRGPQPEDGDKIICLRNYWDIFSEEEENPLVNGTIGYLKDSYEDFRILPRNLYPKQKVEMIRGHFISDSDDTYLDLNMDKHMILTGESFADRRTIARIASNKKFQDAVPMQFTYGYAITCHKAQGSEWDKVLVIEEKFPFDKVEHARWLYTACTRAASRLVLVR